MNIDLPSLLIDIVIAALENIWTAIVDFGDRVAVSVVLKGFPLGSFWVNLIDEFEQLFRDLSSSGERAAVQVLAQQILPAGKFSHSVMKVSDVFSLIVRTLTVDGYAAISLSTPYALKIQQRMGGSISRAKALASGSIENILNAFVFKPFKTLWLKLILFLIDVAFRVLRQFGLIVLIIVLGDFLFRVALNPEQVFKSLGQKTPRQSVHSFEDGVIRRRKVGGSPP